MITFIDNLSDIELVMLSITALAFILQLVFYWRNAGRVAFLRKKDKGDSSLAEEGVSVILTARNEYEKLEQLLPALLEQDYPLYEVIVVNDCSIDDSDLLLSSLQDKYPHLQYRTIEESALYKHGKRMSTGVGLRAAKYPWVLFTHIDCIPAGNEWLKSVGKHFDAEAGFVLGYARTSNSNAIVRADLFFQGVRYLGAALNGQPYIGIGKNLAMRKNIFFEANGFDPRVLLRHKEEQIFVSNHATKQNTRAEVSPQGVVNSTLPLSFSQWWRLRTDELYSHHLFKAGHRNPGWLELLSRTVFYAAIIASALLLRTNFYALIGLGGAFLLRLISQIIVLSKAQWRLGERRLLFPLLLWDLISPFVYLVLFVQYRIIFARKAYC